VKPPEMFSGRASYINASLIPLIYCNHPSHHSHFCGDLLVSRVTCLMSIDHGPVVHRRVHPPTSWNYWPTGSGSDLFIACRNQLSYSYPFGRQMSSSCISLALLRADCVKLKSSLNKFRLNEVGNDAITSPVTVLHSRYGFNIYRASTCCS